MNKYDWSNVPKEVKWIATDEDGVSNGFIDKPTVFDEDMWAIDENYDAIVLFSGVFQGNWQDSLEERPNDPTTD